LRACPAAWKRFLRDLPEWFGIEEALRDYVEQARSLPTYAATVRGRVVGLCLVRQHSRCAAEVVLIAVDRSFHRQGIGRALLEHVEADLSSQGTRYLQVKTLGASHPSREYAATRLFYEALGFCGLEEIEGLWPGNPCLVMVKHLGP
jgi:ribosomal protein S18 acetylase RimI-like enzyme